MTDYFPLKQGLRHTYSFTSSDFSGTATVHIDILKTETNEAGILAHARMIFCLRDTHISDFTITNDGKWLITKNGIITGGRKEFPIPPELGKKWVESPDTCFIQSMSDTIETPAGKFENCMKVVNLIADGDGGMSTRWYAPDMGLVYEDCHAEDGQGEVKLIAKTKIPETAE